MVIQKGVIPSEGKQAEYLCYGHSVRHGLSVGPSVSPYVQLVQQDHLYPAPKQ